MDNLESLLGQEVWYYHEVAGLRDVATNGSRYLVTIGNSAVVIPVIFER